MINIEVLLRLAPCRVGSIKRKGITMNYADGSNMMASEPKQPTIADTVEELGGNVLKLSQMLNALCANMAGAETDSPKELPNAPLLNKLGMITDGTRFCLERVETLFKIMGQ